MYIRIAGIELIPPILRRFMEPDGGLVVYCEAIEGDHDESKLKKFLDLEDTTQHVKWEDNSGMIHDNTMTILGTDVSSWARWGQILFRAFARVLSAGTDSLGEVRGEIVNSAMLFKARDSGDSETLEPVGPIGELGR